MKPQEFVEVLFNAGYESQSYSGRGMFGSQCVAVTPESSVSAEQFVMDVVCSEVQGADDIDMANDRVEELRRVFRRTQQDQMGLGIVLYWPDMRWPG